MVSAAMLAQVFAQSNAWVAVYWISTIVGGGLVIFSSMGGDGGEADFDADVGDAPGVDQAAGALTRWFSTRFVVFFAAIFGAVGVVLTHLTSTGALTTLSIALAAGLVAGQGVQRLFAHIGATSGNTATRPQDYVNKLGRVTAPISGHLKGEVAIQVLNAERCVAAICTGNEAELGVDEEVVVVAYRGGVAQVLSRSEFERTAGEGGVR